MKKTKVVLATSALLALSGCGMFSPGESRYPDIEGYGEVKEGEACPSEISDEGCEALQYIYDEDIDFSKDIEPFDLGSSEVVLISGEPFVEATVDYVDHIAIADGSHSNCLADATALIMSVEVENLTDEGISIQQGYNLAPIEIAYMGSEGLPSYAFAPTYDSLKSSPGDIDNGHNLTDISPGETKQSKYAFCVWSGLEVDTLSVSFMSEFAGYQGAGLEYTWGNMDKLSPTVWYKSHEVLDELLPY